MQGGTDSGNHFQSVTREKFEGKVDNLLQWLDDFLLHSKSENSLLNDIGRFLAVCAQFGFKINAKKTSFFMKEAEYCGRILSKSGFKFDPRNTKTILNINLSSSVDQLQQLLCAANWMRTAIPDFSRITFALHQLKEASYKQANFRKKATVSNISLHDKWSAEHTEPFEKIKAQLATSTELAHPKPDCQLCLFVHASETHWSADLTQSPLAQICMPIESKFTNH